MHANKFEELKSNIDKEAAALQIKEFQNLPKEENSEDQKQKILYNFMIIKYKADDELYLKYHLTEHQLKYLLFELNEFLWD